MPITREEHLKAAMTKLEVHPCDVITPVLIEIAGELEEVSVALFQTGDFAHASLYASNALDVLVVAQKIANDINNALLLLNPDGSTPVEFIQAGIDPAEMSKALVAYHDGAMTRDEVLERFPAMRDALARAMDAYPSVCGAELAAFGPATSADA